MQGRIESQLKNEKKLQKELEQMPDYLVDYISVKMTSRECTSCIEITKKIKDFLKSINKNMACFKLSLQICKKREHICSNHDKIMLTHKLNLIDWRNQYAP